MFQQTYRSNLSQTISAANKSNSFFYLILGIEVVKTVQFFRHFIEWIGTVSVIHQKLKSIPTKINQQFYFLTENFS